MTDNKFIDKILLCRIGSNHYDSVFAKSFIDSSAVCQGMLDKVSSSIGSLFLYLSGLMYELLYGQVFGMEDIDTAVQVMLYEGKQSKDFAEVKLCPNLCVLKPCLRICLTDQESGEGVQLAPQQRHQRSSQGWHAIPLQSGQSARSSHVPQRRI